MSQGAFLVVICVLALATFGVSVLQPQKRTIIFLTGAGLIGAIGIVSGRYTAIQVWNSINLPVLTLIFALILFSDLLRDTKLLEWLGSMLEQKYNNPASIQVLLLITMYVFSMFVNNLAAILVLLPLIFRLDTTFRFDTKRFLVALVIASNLGGASTLIGDFPNIIISQDTGATFMDFILFLGGPIFVLAMCSFFLLYRPHLKKNSAEAQKPKHVTEIRLLKKVSESPILSVEWRNVLLWLLCFIIMLIAIGVVTRIEKAFIVIGSVIVLLVVLRAKDEIIRQIDLSVLVFFGALFIIVGGLGASGLFDLVSKVILERTQNMTCIALAFMLFASIITALFSAGPTTASLIPVAVSLQGVVPGNIIWWSLSLGVLAGSSGTLIGATAGPVMASLYERERRDTFTLTEFSRVGLPAMLIYLVLSSVYIILLTVLR